MSAVNNNFKKWSQTLYHTIQSDISINYTDRVLYRICSFWLRQYWTRVSMTIIPSRMMGSIWRRDFSQLNIQKSWKRVQQQQHKAKGNYISIQNISLVLCFKWWGLFFLESVDVGRFLRVLQLRFFPSQPLSYGWWWQSVLTGCTVEKSRERERESMMHKNYIKLKFRYP